MPPVPAWMFNQQNNDGDAVDEITHDEEADDGHLMSNAEEGTTDEYDPNNVNTEVVDLGTGIGSVESGMIPKNGFYISKPYKREILAQQLNENSPGANRRMAIIGALRDLGVKVFIIEAKSIQTTADILHHVKRVVGFVARENRFLRYGQIDMDTVVDDEEFTQATSASLGFQRCLLYQDKTGRLFNLMLSSHATGSAEKFSDYLESFSNVQALGALMIMTRSFTCIMEDGALNALKPGFLALILGLCLTEELSLSWLNASMLVRASPSISAHALTSSLGPDMFRKAVLLCLAMAAACTDATIQKYMTITGIGGAVLVLLANIGARSWHFMGWKPLAYQGAFADYMAYGAAIGTGLMYPVMAHRKIHVGGKAGLEHVTITAVVAALAFIMAGVDTFQKFMIVSNEACAQDHVNVVVGAWWFFTAVASLWTVFRSESMDNAMVSSSDNEPLLLASHASPVGFKVPSLPDYEMDPSLAWTGKLSFLHIQAVFVIGIVAAAAMGLGMVWWGVSNWGEDVVDHLQDTTDLFR